jgi:diguanylate cyclase (GGDEF)-like protein
MFDRERPLGALANNRNVNLARLSVLFGAVLCVPLLALARTEMDQRIMELRDLGRLDPEQTLAQLLELQPLSRTQAPRTQAELLVQVTIARRRVSQVDAAAATATQIIAYGKSLHDDVIVAKGLLAMADISFTRDDPKAAHQQIFEAEQLALRSGDKALLSHAEREAGTTSASQGNFPAALSKLHVAVETARQVDDDPMLLFNALRSLASLYVTLKEKDKAFATLDELAALAEKGRLPVQTVLLKTSEYNVASSFDQPERALRALLQSLALLRKLKTSYMLPSTLNNLADSYLGQHDYPRAAQYATEALLATKGRSGASDSDATARVNLGHAYLGMGRIAEGKKNFEAGLAWFEQSHNKPGLQSTLLEYGQALEAAGDLPGAVAAYHRERAISDELFETKRQKAVVEMQEHYEADKRQRQIEMLKGENDNRRQQQRVWWLLAAVFALAAVVVGMLNRKVRRANLQLKTMNLELRVQSTLDPLTGLYNRRHFHEVMAGLAPEAPDRAGCAHGGDDTGALFLLDVDHFKHINDSYGHAAGDAVLKTIAARLRTALRETDIIVRWGGEEFLAFVPAFPRQFIDEVAQRILLGISSQPVRHQDRDIPVHVSVGFAPFPLELAGVPLSWERIVNLTDMALYLAKTKGRNRAFGVRGFGQLQPVSMEEVEQDLERAWRAGQVDLNQVLGAAPASPAPEKRKLAPVSTGSDMLPS